MPGLHRSPTGRTSELGRSPFVSPLCSESLKQNSFLCSCHRRSLVRSYPLLLRSLLARPLRSVAEIKITDGGSVVATGAFCTTNVTAL
ncbi:hypothetical protein U1Q18_001162 [Sarracenia purpurea var. burkii]